MHTNTEKQNGKKKAPTSLGYLLLVFSTNSTPKRRGKRHMRMKHASANRRKRGGETIRSCKNSCEVATISRLLKIVGLFCRIMSLL